MVHTYADKVIKLKGSCSQLSKEKISIALDRELLHSLRREAYANGVSLSGLIESKLVGSFPVKKSVTVKNSVSE